jgi:hypothetical protein
VNVDQVEPFLQDPLISMPWNKPSLRIPPSLSLQEPPAYHIPSESSGNKITSSGCTIIGEFG